MSNTRNLCNASLAKEVQNDKLQKMHEFQILKLRNTEKDIEELSYKILAALHDEGNYEKQTERFLLRDPSSMSTVCIFFMQKGYRVKCSTDNRFVTIK